MTREELIQLGTQIIEEDDDDRQEELMELFNKNVPHPEGSSLFFYPEHYNARTMDISSYDPSVEEVVDKCLAYKGIVL
ncbi:MAG: bacteriocin immunity protein [Capnocytophaga sp.]|nr:bacteriocin immunity protein [Capnocytophaga sp.]